MMAVGISNVLSDIKFHALLIAVSGAARIGLVSTRFWYNHVAV